jgi:hypothetical protein
MVNWLTVAQTVNGAMCYTARPEACVSIGCGGYRTVWFPKSGTGVPDDHAGFRAITMPGLAKARDRVPALMRHSTTSLG